MPALLEFIIVGTPVTYRAKKKRKRDHLRKWKSKVKEVAGRHWKWPQNEPMKDKLQCTIIYFHRGPDAPLDNDNLCKPILDAMSRTIYDDDKQLIHTHVYQTDIAHPIPLEGASTLVVNAIRDGNDFVYVRFDSPQESITLPT
jgi:Holliday junction resolvase RusA-like endonuclease